MIYPEAGDHAFTDQPEYEFMGLPEHIDIFHPDRTEIVDVEKPAVIDLIGSDLPERQPVNLLPQKLVEHIEAFGFARDPVEYVYIFCDESLHFGAVGAEISETPFDDFLFAIPLGHPFSAGLDIRGKISQSGDNAQEFLILPALRRQDIFQYINAVLKDRRICLRC